MKHLRCTLVATALLLAACQAADRGAPEPQAGAREVTRYSVVDFLDTTSFGGGSFSPDHSRVLVHSDATGIFNAYAIPTSGGEPVQLTDSTEDSIFVLGYFPADERFLYTADQGGNELDHLYVRELDGSVVELTPGEGLKATFYGWAQDDQTFFIGTNERDHRYFDVYEYQARGYQRELVYRNDTGHQFADISPDRRHIALAKIETRGDSDIYLHDRESGETQHLTPHEGEVNHFTQGFSPDGQSLYFTTDLDSEFRYLVRHDLGSGERAVVERPDWDVMFSYFSKRGKYLVVGVNNDARTELKMYQAATMTPVELPQLDADVTRVRLSRDEIHMTFYASTGRIPSDLFVQELGSGGAPRQLTRSLSETIDPEDLVQGQVVRFASFDGLEIPGVLYRPHQAGPDNKLPALVWVHGGPGGQARVRYSALIQFLVNHGYVVYAINNRGSSGYGKTFYHLDDRKHGKGDLDDCVASKGMLAATGYVDPERIGIAGGSYGGYMTLAALTFRPEEFAAGIDLFGISNWQRTVQNIPPWWEAIRKSLEDELGDFEDEEYLRSISPLFHAEQIQRPLMVLQGANDPRVLKAESDEIVAAARANGVPVEYVVFDDEGHGFVKKENRERGYQAMLEFLDQHLKGGSSGEPNA